MRLGILTVYCVKVTKALNTSQIYFNDARGENYNHAIVQSSDHAIVEL